MRRIAILGLILFLVLFGAYTALWFFVAGRMTHEVASWAERERPHKLDVSWEALRVGGYPFAFRIVASEVRLRDLTPGRAAEIRLPTIEASAHPWDLQSWAVDAPAGLTAVAGSAGAPRARLTAQSVAGGVVLGTDHDVAISLDLAHPVIEASGRIAAREAVVSASVPQEPPHSHDDATLSLGIEAYDLQMPKIPAPIGGTVDELAFDLTVLGPVPNLPPREAAAAWRDAGGTIEVEKISARAGDLAVAGSGTFALDSEMQPEAAFSGSVEGYDKLIAGLTQAGLLPLGSSVLAHVGLALMSHPGADGQPQIKTSFTIQNGAMMLGPIKLGSAPRIEWD